MWKNTHLGFISKKKTYFDFHRTNYRFIFLYTFFFVESIPLSTNTQPECEETEREIVKFYGTLSNLCLQSMCYLIYA